MTKSLVAFGTAALAMLTAPSSVATTDPYRYTMMLTPEEGPLDPIVEGRYTRALSNCQKAAQITSDNAVCFEAEFRRQDIRLNQAWAAAFRRTAPVQRPALRAAQRRWVAARDPFCRSASDEFAGGTIAPVISSSCRAEQTIRRTLWLEELAKGG